MSKIGGVYVCLCMFKVVGTPASVPHLIIMDVQVLVALQTHVPGLVTLTLCTSLPLPARFVLFVLVRVYRCVCVTRAEHASPGCLCGLGFKFI